MLVTDPSSHHVMCCQKENDEDILVSLFYFSGINRMHCIVMLFETVLLLDYTESTHYRHHDGFFAVVLATEEDLPTPVKVKPNALALGQYDAPDSKLSTQH